MQGPRAEGRDVSPSSHEEVSQTRRDSRPSRAWIMYSLSPAWFAGMAQEAPARLQRAFTRIWDRRQRARLVNVVAALRSGDFDVAIRLEAGHFVALLVEKLLDGRLVGPRLERAALAAKLLVVVGLHGVAAKPGVLVVDARLDAAPENLKVLVTQGLALGRVKVRNEVLAAPVPGEALEDIASAELELLDSMKLLI